MDEEWKRASNRKWALDKQRSVFSRQKSKFSCSRREKKTTKRQKLDGTGGYILYSNANGLTNKMDEIQTCLCVYDDINVLCITKTHLKKSVLDAEIEIEGYKFFRKDRNFNIKNNDIATKNLGVDYNSSGGGSIIYYRNDINAKIVEDFSERAPDSLAIELDSNIGQFCIACIYRSPNLTTPMNNIAI